MTHYLFNIRWLTGDNDNGLTQAEAQRMLAQLMCHWGDGPQIKDAEGNLVGYISRVET